MSNRVYFSHGSPSSPVTFFYREPYFSTHEVKQIRYFQGFELLNEKKYTPASKKHLELLKAKQKDVYVSNAIDSRLGKELVANEPIFVGDFICLYEGQRFLVETCNLLESQGYPTDYMFNLDDEVVVDANHHRFGAAMANHSCNPNAALMSTFLCGLDLPPIGYLSAIKDISVGSPITCSYGNDKIKNPLPERCYCGEDNCVDECGEWLGRTNSNHSCIECWYT